MVVCNIEKAVFILRSVWIGDVCALIQHQTARPSAAVIEGKLGHQIVAAVEMVMIDHQKIAGTQTADEEAGTGTAQIRKLLLPPGFAFIVREGFADAVIAAYQHPQRAIPAFHHHVLVETAVGNVRASQQNEGLAVVIGGIHIGETLMGALRMRLAGFHAGPDGTGEEPCAVLEHCWFAHHDAVANASGFAEGKLFQWGVGIFTDDGPHAVSAVKIVVGDRPGDPQSAQRIKPDIGIEKAYALGIRMTDDRHGIDPGCAVMITGGEYDIVAVLFCFSAGIEYAEQTSLWTALHGSNALPAAHAGSEFILFRQKKYLWGVKLQLIIHIPTSLQDSVSFSISDLARENLKLLMQYLKNYTRFSKDGAENMHAGL